MSHTDPRYMDKKARAAYLPIYADKLQDHADYMDEHCAALEAKITALTSSYERSELDVNRQSKLRHGAEETVKKQAALVRELAGALRRIINDLPSRRDWLDPAIEREARAALARVGDAPAAERT